MRELCTTLLNCYLIQLLETGFLHADPHPGNLIRTPDGQICILDFGLMTEVSSSAVVHTVVCTIFSAVLCASRMVTLPQTGMNCDCTTMP